MIISPLWLGARNQSGATGMFLTEFADDQARGKKTRARIRREGQNCNGHRIWTKPEDDACRKAYPNYEAMLKELPHRTRSALESRCGVLGIRKPVHQWTGSEDTQFRKMYRAGASVEEICEAFPHMQREDVWRRAYKAKLSRPRKRYLPTGTALLDELREECWRQHITMVDLDQFARSGRYFDAKRWRGQRGRIKYDYIVRGIHELGGTISIKWGDVQ